MLSPRIDLLELDSPYSIRNHSLQTIQIPNSGFSTPRLSTIANNSCMRPEFVIPYWNRKSYLVHKGHGKSMIGRTDLPVLGKYHSTPSITTPPKQPALHQTPPLDPHRLAQLLQDPDLTFDTSRPACPTSAFPIRAPPEPLHVQTTFPPNHNPTAAPRKIDHVFVRCS